MKMIFFDTETTGIMPGSICQLSYILVDTSIKPRRTVGKNFFFSVEYIEPGAQKVHGFSVENLYTLSKGKYFEDCIEEFLTDFQTADILIGHNVKFDIKFLSAEFDGCGEVLNPKHTFCTMNYYKDICNLKNSRGDCKAPKLIEAIEFLNLDETSIELLNKKYFNETGDFHDARFDTAATYLLVTQGIAKGYIPKGYFSKMM